MADRMVLRHRYLEWLDMFRGNNGLVKVIQGVRRCGKSTLMGQFAERLIASGVPAEQVVRMNIETAEFMGLKDHKALYDEVMSRMSSGAGYLFLDEIQRVDGWERAVNALMVDTDLDIYLTGSNSRLLSSELTTYLTGRYVSLRVLPLSFSEYTELRGEGRPAERVLEEYMEFGGFPIIDPVQGRNAAQVVLQDLYASVALHDICERGGIRNIGELSRLLRYMMENVGNPVSLNNVVKGMGDINRGTVERYLGLMEDAFLLYRADRYDIHGTALLPTPKYYAVDPGLRSMAVGYGNRDAGRVLENIVFLELLRRGYSVTVGRWGASEVDFVAERAGSREYFQVCLGYLDESVEERELAPLRGIADNFPKTVIMLYGRPRSVTKDGIIERSAADWLSEE